MRASDLECGRLRLAACPLAQPVARPMLNAPRKLPTMTLALALLAAVHLLQGAGGLLLAAELEGATNSRAAMNDAIHSIPFDQLTEPTQAKVRHVIAQPSIYRRTPTQVVPCDPQMHLFLVRYPEIIVNIWELMGVTKVSLQRTGPYTFHATDGAGTASDVELVYGTENLHLYFAETHYDGPLVPRPVRAKVVLVLRSGGSQMNDGRDQMVNRLDVFIRVENIGADLLARTLQSIVGRATDVNFSESVMFLSRVSQTAEQNGSGMQRLVTRLNRVDPVIRQRFAEISADVSRRAAERSMAATEPESIPSPLAAETNHARPLQPIAAGGSTIVDHPRAALEPAAETATSMATIDRAPPRGATRQTSLQQPEQRPLPRDRATIILRR